MVGWWVREVTECLYVCDVRVVLWSVRVQGVVRLPESMTYSPSPLIHSIPLKMELTPENARLMAENRLKAKHRIQQQSRLAIQQQHQGTSNPSASSTLLNSNNKRPLQVISHESTSPTNPNKRTISNNVRAVPGDASRALQAAIAQGSGIASGSGPVQGQGRGEKHFQGPDTNAPLKNMVGNYVE